MDSWNPEQIQTLMSTLEETVWEHAFSYRLRQDRVQPAHDLCGVANKLALAQCREATSLAEYYEKVEQTLWLCNLLHTFMASRLLTTLPDVISPPLSIRETEVLKWSAKGKTAEDISTILKLKKRTINFHIANAIKKMGAANKTSAVVQAVLSGIL